jgi:hypothetical protein
MIASLRHNRSRRLLDKSEIGAEDGSRLLNDPSRAGRIGWDRRSFTHANLPLPLKSQKPPLPHINGHHSR